MKGDTQPGLHPASLSEMEMRLNFRSLVPRGLWLAATAVLFGFLVGLPASGWAQQGSETDLFQEARVFESEQDYSAAESVYRKVLASDPGNPKALKRLGIVEQTELKFKESIQDFKQVLSQHPDYPQVNFYLGLSYYGLNDLNAAIASFRRELKTPTAHPATRYYLGLSLEAAGKKNEAIDQFNAVAVQRPDDPNILYELARLHIEAAFEAIRTLAKKHPDSFQIYALRGDLFTKEARYPDAITQYKAALRKDPTATGIHYSLAVAYFLTDKWDLAEKEFLLALRESPKDSLTNLYLGDLVLMKQQFTKALPYLKQAEASDPKSVQAHLLLGRCYIGLGELQKAKDELLATARLDPAGPRSHYLLSRVYRKLKQPADSQRELAIFEKLSKKQQAQEDAEATGKKPLGSAPESTH